MPEGSGSIDDISYTHDRESDTFYATFNTGEPSFCIETDDVLLLEVGIFSNLPTGFRVLNFSQPGSKEKALETVKALSASSAMMRQQAAHRADERTQNSNRL